MRSEQRNLPIAVLRFGQDHPGLAVNARTTDRNAGIPELVESIAIEGLLQPLLIWDEQIDRQGHGPEAVMGGPYWVADGSRRFTALAALQHANPKCASVNFAEIPCLVISECTAGEVLAKSLAVFANTLPPHPVDQFEGFAELRNTMPELTTEGAAEKIAQRYGVTRGLIMRRLALGRLAPEIRDAWRAGQMDMKTAQAFTLLADPADQLKAFETLSTQGAFNDYVVRQHIVGDEADQAKMLKLVGAKAYEDAGGRIRRDLFSEIEGAGDTADDPVLLRKLALDRVEAAATELTTSGGWEWAQYIDALPKNWSIAFDRKHLPAKAKAADKKGRGCVLTIAPDGTIGVEYGVKKPSEAPEQKQDGGGAKWRKEAKANAEAPGPEAPRLANIHLKALGRQANLAIAATVEQAHPTVAIAALLATLLTQPDMEHATPPMSATLGGLARRETGRRLDVRSWGSVFKHALTGKTALALALKVAAAAVDLGTFPEDEPLHHPDVMALLNALDQKILLEQLRKAFKAKEYFDVAPKPLLLAAIGEALGAEHAEQRKGDSKADLAEFCAKNVPKTGWLPPQLRPDGYKLSPHGAASPSKAKKKPKAK